MFFQLSTSFRYSTDKQKVYDRKNKTSKAVFFYMSNWSNLAKCCNIDVAFMC
jgi:hypothetical protein